MKEACEQDDLFMVSWLVTNFPDEDFPIECDEYVEEVMDGDENDIMIKPASKRKRIN